MHPTVSSDILSALRDGRVFVRTNIERLNGPRFGFKTVDRNLSTPSLGDRLRDGFRFSMRVSLIGSQAKAAASAADDAPTDTKSIFRRAISADRLHWRLADSRRG